MESYSTLDSVSLSLSEALLDLEPLRSGQSSPCSQPDIQVSLNKAVFSNCQEKQLQLESPESSPNPWLQKEQLRH